MIRCEYIHEGEFEFEAGGSVSALKVVYHRSEREWRSGDDRKVIWICHALTAKMIYWWNLCNVSGKFGKIFYFCGKCHLMQNIILLKR